MTELESLLEDIAAEKRNCKRARYSKELRDQIGAYAMQQMDAGIPCVRVARTLGIGVGCDPTLWVGRRVFSTQES